MNDLQESSAFRPSWLSGVSQQDQQHHDYLMQEMIAKESKRDQLLGNVASLKAYGSARAREWINSALGVSVDPEKIIVTCRYQFEVGRRQIVQEDKRTFAELALFGLHDRGHRYVMEFDGQVPSGLTQSAVENWLAGTEVRLDFWGNRRKALNDSYVQIALIDVLTTRIAYSVFAAKLQGHLNQPRREMVERFLQGDPSISASAFVMNGYRFGFRDLMVFQQKANPFGNCALYAPGSPDGRDWHEFTNIRELEFHVAGWVQTSQGLNFLVAQARPAERATLAKYLKTLQELPSAWKGATFSEWPLAPEGILAEAVFHQIAWDQAQESLENPVAWRNASAESRQLFARLNTELKALYTVGTRETAVPSFDRFCHGLVKEAVEQKILHNYNKNVQVNPDQIFIELSSTQHVTLTTIFAKEIKFKFIRPENGGFPEYPRIRVAANHQGLPRELVAELAVMSRELYAGDKYIAMMHGEYLDEQHQQYQFRREVHLMTERAEMRRSVLASFYAGLLASNVRDQLFQLIDEVSRNTRPFEKAGAGVTYSAVFKFYVKGCLIEGVYIFRLVQNGRITEILYTPNAPDGIHLRPFDQFFVSIKEHGLGQYYYDRVQYIDQRIMGTFVNNIEFRNISESFPEVNLNRQAWLRNSHNERIERIISTVDAQTTSRNEILAKAIYDAAVLAATVVSLVVPPVGVALTAVTITKNLVEGIEAYRYGDRAAAFNNFKDILVDLALLVPGGKKLTRLQRTFIEFVGDTKTMLDLLEMTTGHSISSDHVVQLVERIHSEGASGISKTLVR